MSSSEPRSPTSHPPRRELSAWRDSDDVPLKRPLGIWTVAEALLKAPAGVLYEIRQGAAGAVTGRLVLLGSLCLLVYGLVTGMFSWGDQIWAAPLKITIGTLLSALICFPSLFVFSCLTGSRAGLRELGGIQAGLVAVTGLLLLAMGPVLWVFTQSTESVLFMGLLHLLLWMVALWYGLSFLLRSARRLGGRIWGGQLLVWCVIFLLVLLQMSTALRPLVGESDRLLQPEKKFFLTHWVECLERACD